MTKGKEVYNGVKIASSTNDVGRAGQLHAKNEIWSSTYTIHKNEFKVDKRLKYKCDTIKVLEKNIGRKISDISHSNIFMICPLEQGT